MTNIMTAEQHRWMARNLRLKAGLPGYPSVRAEQMARNHDTMAKMIDRRESGAPPLAPV